MESGEIVPGVVPLDHTADLGIEVRGDSLAALFERAAAGMMALIGGEESGGAEGPATERRVIAAAPDAAALLVAWLRELLFLHLTEGFVLRKVTFDRLDEHALDARLIGVLDARPPEREIKAVTWHALEARRNDGGWYARVIFDV